MTPGKLILTMFAVLVLVGGSVLEASAGGGGGGATGCIVNTPAGYPLNGAVALDISNFNENQLTGDVDVTLSLERMASRNTFRIFVAGMEITNPVNIACAILEAQTSTGTVQTDILNFFGFPSTYRIVVAPDSISDTDGKQSIPDFTGAPTGRESVLANVRIYATKK